MSFWDIFIAKEEAKPKSVLQSKVQEQFPNYPESKRILISCLAGLCARIAYVDFDISPKEKDAIKGALSKWMNLSEEEADFVATSALDEVKELSGIEPRKYCTALNDLLDNDDKLHILESLFQVSAADGNVEELESEEIRIIATALLLEHKHFIAARATVAKYLGALK
ncbi:hypothetical protein BIY24_12580 [Halobacteriovorax marinus]|uniref:Co-chaperone DjlA N-terminal domain-containing protein n=1 Tax=Halobacteriovorax marinus (strain ATCC BAA-682 / DSM 15412 / SJ) TaxID=862908 RepID=E1WXD3_HALMS|nr:TerB family tellurite resistance protein [Halobacteriovorax marinus]ATH08751.1 hypothetical protein BIY24_12580 [Halobacteriovorax marinus]CBW27450.1 conserved hypothetical protein [Halobacteriovorax marinus SJ]